MTKVFEYFDSKWGKAFYRISEALHKYSPEWVEWINSESNSEINIIHEVGGGEIKPIQDSLDNKKKTIIIQHTYFTSGYNEWDSLWEKANLTISFHDLPTYTKKHFNFYATPWGYDPSIFYNKKLNKINPIFVTGHIANTEHIDDVYNACRFLGLTLLHTGEDFKWGNFYKFLPYMDNKDFANLLNTVTYTSCLRSVEGFEMVGVEGLACGAIPIVLDLPTYRWYKGFGIFINPNNYITEQLVEILSHKPDINIQQDKVREAFAWDNIIRKLFLKVQEYTS